MSDQLFEPVQRFTRQQTAELRVAMTQAVAAEKQTTIDFCLSHVAAVVATCERATRKFELTWADGVAVGGLLRITIAARSQPAAAVTPPATDSEDDIWIIRRPPIGRIAPAVVADTPPVTAGDPLAAQRAERRQYLEARQATIERNAEQNRRRDEEEDEDDREVIRRHQIAAQQSRYAELLAELSCVEVDIDSLIQSQPVGGANPYDRTMSDDQLIADCVDAVLGFGVADRLLDVSARARVSLAMNRQRRHELLEEMQEIAESLAEEGIVLPTSVGERERQIAAAAAAESPHGVNYRVRKLLDTDGDVPPPGGWHPEPYTDAWHKRNLEAW